MKKRSYGNSHLKFLIIGVILVVVLDRFVLGDACPYIEETRREISWQAEEAEISQTKDKRDIVLALLEPEIVTLQNHVSKTETFGPADLSPWKKFAVPVILDPEKPKIVIVIDDLGVSREHSQEILELPAPLTLAFLPYAERLESLVSAGKQKGHEIMVHMPMEPMNGDLDTGDIFLDMIQSPAEFDGMLEKGLGAISGYVGMNNHMGSRLTQDKEAMQRLMAVLHKRGLLFLDSRTIASSVAAETAAQYHVPYAVRDVFLDDDPSLENVRERLKQTERIALEYGQAIAIGHPKPYTIQALQEWLPTLQEKNIQLVPVSAAVIAPEHKNAVAYEPSLPGP